MPARDPAQRPAGPALGLLIASTVVPTFAASLAGVRAWAVPQRVYAGWQVAQVPGSLWALLALAVALCLVPAFVLLCRAAPLRPGRPAAVGWLGIHLLAVAALVLNALVLAADGAVDSGPPIPIFHWAFTAVPALLAGAVTGLAARTGRWSGLVGVLASAVVTLPLFTLGWSLYLARTPDPVAGSLFLSAALGIIPLAVVVAVIAALDRVHQADSAAPPSGAR